KPASDERERPTHKNLTNSATRAPVGSADWHGFRVNRKPAPRLYEALDCNRAGVAVPVGGLCTRLHAPTRIRMRRRPEGNLNLPDGMWSWLISVCGADRAEAQSRARIRATGSQTTLESHAHYK